MEKSEKNLRGEAHPGGGVGRGGEVGLRPTSGNVCLRPTLPPTGKLAPVTK